MAQLPYLNAVIEETLRLYSPVPVALTRIVPSEGAPISGHWVPGNVSYPLLFLFCCSRERPLSESLTEQPSAPLEISPTPPRSFQRDGCRERIVNSTTIESSSVSHSPQVLAIVWAKGRTPWLILRPLLTTTSSLADAEMRLVLAHLFFNFDFKLVDKESRWDEQHAFVLYMKQPLMLHVEARSSL